MPALTHREHAEVALAEVAVGHLPDVLGRLLVDLADLLLEGLRWTEDLGAAEPPGELSGRVLAEVQEHAVPALGARELFGGDVVLTQPAHRSADLLHHLPGALRGAGGLQL